MCGIAGIYDPRHSLGMPAEVLRRMADVIRHRGPDDEGFYENGVVALAMKRLSIIDLATGHQPVANEEGTVHAVRFRGMFAFALWDTRARTLLIARDRLGIKPLHYTEQNGALVFGSELKSILCHPKVPRDINLEAMDYFFTYRYIPDPLTIFRGIRKLPAGHLLVARDGQVDERCYWEAPEPDEDTARQPDLARRLLERLDDAVQARLVSDVPLGAFLSGGIDSSTVVSGMARAVKEPVKPFSIGFEEERFNEVGYARITARRYGTDHHERVVDSRDFGLLDEIVGFFDEPFGDVSSIPTYLLSKLARERVTVALSGDGGDELFAGYDRYRVDRDFARVDLLPPSLRRALFGAIASAWPEGWRGGQWIDRLGRPRVERYLLSGSSLNESERGALYAPELWDQLGLEPPRDRFLTYWESRGGDPIDRLLYLDLKTYLVGDILTKVDRMSMATSLEVRVPLLDHPFVELAMRIPARLKLAGDRGKQIFREAVAERVPQEVMSRPKHGFSVPVLGWLNGSLAAYTDEILLDGRTAGRPYFNHAWVKGVLSDPGRRRTHAYKVWLLLVFELWHRRYLDAA
jgi:asparagine synthase (glutamine-hydrolysing)